MEQKSKATAFLLCYFLGVLGVHRFYLNRVITGLLMLITAGGLGIWWLVDAILLAAGKLNDGKGQPLRVGPPDPSQSNAGFWVRLAAMSVDGLVLTAVGAVLMIIMGVITAIVLPTMIPAGGEPDPAAIAPLVAAVYGTIFLVGLLYFAIQTGGRHQATWGKRAFGLMVAPRSGGSVGFLRALWRSLCYVLSGIPLYIGFIIAGFGARKLALHDYLAGTEVVYRDAAPATNAPALVDSGSFPTVPGPREQDVAPAKPDTGALVMLLGGAVLLAAAAYLMLG